jgi:MoaA/NifB/PqqE/SkfB family radical SAM enzyme
MNLKIYLKEFLPKTLNYKLARKGVLKPAKPITLTFSVTCACNSLCKTCHIGKMYRENPNRIKNDLKIKEIEKIFKSMGHIYFFNISGGEPFLRNDFQEIIELACKYLKPGIIHSPTNAIVSKKILNDVKGSLKIIEKYNPKIQFTIKPSIDGVGKDHDEIRGVPGNFKMLEETIRLLKPLQEKYPNFHLELGTVVSNFNIKKLDEIEDYVHSVGIQSYRNEIAEQREEFFNLKDPITPTAEQYQKLMKRFKNKIRENVRGKKLYTKVTEAFRLVYYDLVSEILRQKTQVIPCYGGISNVHINYNGEVWPCCVLGYKKPLGNLRDYNYNFKKLWNSKKAANVRKYIADKKCYCPLANQSYSNILLDFKSLLKVVKNILKMN